MTTNQATATPHVLYRMYDAAGQLLYAGISANWPGRFNFHRHQKSWWTEITTIHLEHFSDETGALQAEREVIKTETPKYNVAHLPLGTDALDRRSAAAYLGVKIQSLHGFRQTYRDFPEPEYVGRIPVWKPADLDAWRAKHPAKKKPDPPTPGQP